jgi:cytochrome c peroxidase
MAASLLTLCTNPLSDSAATASELAAFAVPLGLVRPYIPENNQLTREKVELGKLLFNDTRLSADNQVSCGTCHPRETAFTDGKPLSNAVFGQHTRRNTPTVLNAALFQHFNWDGKAKSLEDQAKIALLNPEEMGTTEDRISSILLNDRTYSSSFERVFGSSSLNNAVLAIASYERSLLYANSPFDRFLFCDEKTAISNAAKRGYKVFLDKGNCIICHQIQHESLHPFGVRQASFTDDRFHNLGVGVDVASSDLGRYEITGDSDDIGAFKTPSLRNVALTAPYMHDGSLPSLEAVVDFYDRGGIANENRDPGIRPLHLSAQDKADLVEFLQSLTGVPYDPQLHTCRGGPR